MKFVKFDISQYMKTPEDWAALVNVLLEEAREQVVKARQDALEEAAVAAEVYVGSGNIAADIRRLKEKS